MKIKSISIRNHSRISDCSLDVRDNLILVGANGSGKSSVIRCIDLVLGRTTQQLYRSIDNSDFEDEEQPFAVEVKLEGLSEDERSFFPDDYDALDNSLTVRMEATLDKDDLTIRRYFPKGAGENNLRREQLESIGWSMIPSDFSTTQLEPGRKTIVDDYLKEVDASGDESKLAEAIKSLSDAIDGSDAFKEALGSLADQLDPVLDGGITANKLHFVPGAAINGDLLNDVRLQIEGKSGTARQATEQSDGTKALIAFSIFGLLNSGGMIAIGDSLAPIGATKLDAHSEEHRSTTCHSHTFWCCCWRVRSRQRRGYSRGHSTSTTQSRVPFKQKGPGNSHKVVDKQQS